MAKPKKSKDKPTSQHEPTPEELDEAIQISDIDGEWLLKGLLGTRPQKPGDLDEN